MSVQITSFCCTDANNFYTAPLQGCPLLRLSGSKTTPISNLDSDCARVLLQGLDLVIRFDDDLTESEPDSVRSDPNMKYPELRRNCNCACSWAKEWSVLLALNMLVRPKLLYG